MFKWRKAVCWPILAILPASLQGQDNGAAVLHSSGSVLLNQNPAVPTSALFADDLIEIREGGAARIEAAGSAVDINSGTLVQFEGNELVLDHGSLSVNTSRGLRVRVGCVTVVPANEAWTDYEVTDTDGRVTVSARKNDVNIDSRAAKTQSAKESGRERVTLREGEQKSREEKC